MIISANSAPHKEEFNLLLSSTLIELNWRAKNSENELIHLGGDKLEPFIKDVMAAKAVGTAFENSIELISGQKFPDIVANKFYGIEVKSTKQNHWKTTGNSVLESTRVENVERIFMLFGKLGKPIEFRCRPYEECLSEVVVTHSPRYLIDMNLSKGSTIFDKMKIEYDTLRKKSNPLKSVVDYYKSKLKPGEDIWWIGQEDNAASNLIVKKWKNLSNKEKQELKIKAMAFFPEIFSNKPTKYERLPVWLITREAVMYPALRDLFTSGGKCDIPIGRKIYQNAPRIFATLINNLSKIIETLLQTSATELTEHWQQQVNEKNKVKHWIELVSTEGNKIKDATHLDLKTMINEAYALLPNNP